jgi:uncharacterized alkaline shock family protein YloU
MTTRVAAIAVADLVSVTAASVDGVVAVAPDPRHPVATYGPGRRVAGVQVQRRNDRDRIAVHVAATFGPHLPTLAEDVRTAVSRALTEHLPDHGPWTINVHIAHIVAPGDPHHPHEEVAQ